MPFTRVRPADAIHVLLLSIRDPDSPRPPPPIDRLSAPLEHRLHRVDAIDIRLALLNVASTIARSAPAARRRRGAPMAVHQALQRLLRVEQATASNQPAR